MLCFYALWLLFLESRSCEWRRMRTCPSSWSGISQTWTTGGKWAPTKRKHVQSSGGCATWRLLPKLEPMLTRFVEHTHTHHSPGYTSSLCWHEANTNWTNFCCCCCSRCFLTSWEKSGREKWKTAKRRTARRKVKVWLRELERGAVFYSGKVEQVHCFMYIYISQTFAFVLCLDLDLTMTLCSWLAEHMCQKVVKVALHTPFIALTFYVLTLQIIYDPWTLSFLTLTTLKSLIHEWCFKLGLSLPRS